jgi:hypothetical protein
MTDISIIPKEGRISTNKNVIIIPPKKAPKPSKRYTLSGERILEAAGKSAPKTMQVGTKVKTDMIIILLRSMTSPRGRPNILGAILRKHKEKTNRKQSISSNRAKTLSGSYLSLMLEKTRLPIPPNTSQRDNIIPETNSLPLKSASASRIINV